MNNVDRYLQQATRGLWGNKRAIARLELRSAIEDKVYRYTLLGHPPQDAERYALRDLGSPSAVAKDLSAVHSLSRGVPLTVGFGLLLSVMLFPLQGAAQVQGAPFSLELARCDFSPAGRAALNRTGVSLPAEFNAFSRQQLEQWCHVWHSSDSPLLDYQVLLTVLRSKGVQVADTMPDAQGNVAGPNDGFTWLRFPGTPVAIRLPATQRTQDGREVIEKQALIRTLLETKRVPVFIRGDINPEFTIGSVRLVLGSKEAPVQASDFYTSALVNQLGPQWSMGESSDPALFAALAGTALPGAPRRVNTRIPDGTWIAVVLRQQRDAHGYDGQVPTLYTTRVEQGGFSLPQVTQGQQIRFVDDLKALNSSAGQARYVGAVLQLTNTDALHQLGYKVLAPSLIGLD